MLLGGNLQAEQKYSKPGNHGFRRQQNWSPKSQMCGNNICEASVSISTAHQNDKKNSVIMGDKKLKTLNESIEHIFCFDESYYLNGNSVSLNSWQNSNGNLNDTWATVQVQSQQDKVVWGIKDRNGVKIKKMMTKEERERWKWKRIRKQWWLTIFP